MFVSEIAKKCEITKKAVQYYVEQGLITPIILENGYHDYSDEDVKILNKIVLYRKLGFSIQEIKSILNDPDEITCILHQKTLKLEEEKVRVNLLKKVEAGNTIEDLAEEIDCINSNQIVLNKLTELFPSYYGNIISLHFSRYLYGNIENEEQLKVFYQIVDFFDHVEIKEPDEEIKQYLEAMEEEMNGEIFTSIFVNKELALQDIDDYVEKNKEALDAYVSYKQSEEYKNSPSYKLSEYMKAICSSNGYYDVFIPAMCKLSPSYNKYYGQLLKADKIFAEKYPEYVGK